MDSESNKAIDECREFLRVKELEAENENLKISAKGFINTIKENENQISSMSGTMGEIYKENEKIKDLYEKQMRVIKWGIRDNEWYKCDRCPVWTPEGHDDLTPEFLCEFCWIEHQEST
jgi:hypothetical protein